MAETVDLYLRKSTKDAGRSVARQLDTLTAGAAGEGLVVGKVFVDADFSASRFATRARPGYAELVAHARCGECGVIGLFEASRGSRTLTEWSTLLDLCRARRVRVWIFDDRVYKPWRTNDYDTLARLGVASATESNVLSDRVTSGKKAAAFDEKGGRPVGKALYGLTRTYTPGVGGKLVITQSAHPEESPIAAEMVERVAAGDPLRAVAEGLNARGLTRRSGAAWTALAVRSVVLNVALAGRRTHRGADVGPAAWEPIVDVALWRQAVAALGDPARLASTRGTELRHWLSAVALCGACRRDTLRSRSRSGGCSRIYACRACGKVFVSAPALEAVAEAAVLARLDTDAGRAAFAPAPDTGEAAREAHSRAEALRGELAAFHVEAAAAGASLAYVVARERVLGAAIGSAEGEARRLAVPSALHDLADVDVVAEWGSFGPATRRRIARALMDLAVSPTTRRGPVFDPARLDGSRWAGDGRTWGELRAGEL